MNLYDTLKKIEKPENAMAIKWLLDNKKITIEKLEKIVLNSNNPQIIYNYVTNIEGASLTNAIPAIISLNKPYFMYFMVNYIEELDIDEKKKEVLIKPLITAIGKTKKGDYILSAARSKYADIVELSEYMCDTENPQDIFYFVRDHRNLIPKETLEKLSRRVIELNDSSAMRCISNFRDIPIMEFLNGLLQNKGIVDGHKYFFYPYNLSMFAIEHCNDEELSDDFDRDFFLRRIAEPLVTGEKVEHSPIYDMALRIDNAPLILVDRLAYDYLIGGEFSSYSVDAIIYLEKLVRNGKNNSAYYAAYKLLELKDFTKLRSIIPDMKDHKLARKINNILNGKNPHYRESEFKLTRKKKNKKVGNNH